MEKQKIVLYCASNDTHLRNFHRPYLKFFKDKGCLIHLVSSGDMEFSEVDKKFDIPFRKKIISKDNLRAILMMRDVLMQNRYDMISIHTTLASAVTRLAVMLIGKKRPHIVYTSHGYFFWKGAPWRNWLIYWTTEKICSVVTDTIMTMNQEDFELARNHHLCHDKVQAIPGMGVDLSRFVKVSEDFKNQKRQKFNLSEKDFVLIYPAEMSERKNHQELLSAFALFSTDAPEAKLILPGKGHLMEKNKALIHQLGLTQKVIFPGYVEGMENLYALCDLAVSSASNEGLPLNILEAMASGLPVVASRIRGHTDLIDDGINGLLYTPGNVKHFASLLKAIYHDRNERLMMSAQNVKKVQAYNLNKAQEKIFHIYQEILKL